jgi:hypothetical protein
LIRKSFNLLAHKRLAIELPVGELKDILRNPNMDSDVPSFLQRQLDRANDVISRMWDAVAGMR